MERESDRRKGKAARKETFVHRCKGNFGRVQITTVNSHGCESPPEGVVFDKPAEADGIFPPLVSDELVEHGRVRGDAAEKERNEKERKDRSGWTGRKDKESAEVVISLVVSTR